MLTSGTDANVYFQLIGSEGETEKIQLRQGGKAEKRFEKGRVDKFIVETVDVGMVWTLSVVIIALPVHELVGFFHLPYSLKLLSVE